MAQRIQIFNGRRSGKKTKGKKKKGTRNPLSFLFNGKGGNMSKKKKGKKSNPSHHASHHGSSSRRHTKGRRNTHHSHRHNGMHGGKEGTLNVVLEGGGGALASGLGSHLISELFLSQWNTGFLSYLITAGIGGGIAWLGGKFIGKRFFYGGIAGTVLAVGYRVAEDMGATPAKAVAADVRDAQAAQAGGGGGGPVKGLGRMGTVVNFPFNVPQTYQVVDGKLVPVQPALPAGGGGQPAGGMQGMGRPRAINRRNRY